ncbi:DeoR family transcriptional regulator [Candidatus Enterococcus ferrettii]|uniref:HTH deoR-type domain-containing protein n=1 Tax=Candidatus Enterococcus ferrettii TaxID=2815324 RepID=A0ABV0ENI3_9ENTE|nr:DeoR family transcriptional regulator [Enterococcus sp. 665A]MBO1341288.1 DeoR family transcriptional regulator [Enterococcus sp. 665A]
MFWSHITDKKTQHYLQLLSLLRKRTYTLEELTIELEISEKTLRRDLAYLQKNYRLSIHTKKNTVWNNPQKFSECYKDLLKKSKQFNLFCDALWQRPLEANRWEIQKLNESLLPYTMSISYKTHRLRAPQALLFKLQLRYLQEFDPETIGLTFPEYWEQLSVPAVSHLAIQKWQQLIVETEAFDAFVKAIQPSKELSCLLYFEYQKLNPFRQQRFYESHQRGETFLYQNACKITQSLMHYLDISVEFTTILRIRFFYVLLDLHIGIPVTYFSGSQRPPRIQNHLIEVSKQIKRAWFYFDNWTFLDVSLLLCSILKRIYPVSIGQPIFSLGLQLSGSIEESKQLCNKLNQAIQFSYPIAFFPARSQAITYDLLIIEGPPAYEDKPNETVYIEDPSFGDLIQLAVRYFPSKKGDTVFTIP